MGRDAPPDPATDQQQPFETAARVHERIRSDPSAYPAGWVEQMWFRDRYDLPPFRPPRFADGTRVKETVERLEAELGVEIGFAGDGDGWRVEIDREPAFGIDRYRDDAANTVIEMSAEAFVERIEGAVSGR